MTTAIIITVCVLLLIAYLFDLTSAKTKVPSVILLLLLGFGLHELAVVLGVVIPKLAQILPILGTVGLILIVLEGSLELEFNKSKAGVIKKSLVASLVPMVVLAGLLTFLFQYYSGASVKDCLVNALPICVISSAVAIPSVKGLAMFNKEFVTYESSLSDILGVLLFNFVALNSSFGWQTFTHFGLQLVVICVVSFVATVGLAFLLSKIDHQIKFAPIILLIILIYEISKEYELPGLIFILFFGLFLGNLDEMKQFKWIQRLKPKELNKEVFKFRELIIEAAFLVRALFFLVFGFLIEAAEILNTSTLVWAAGIVAAIFVIRALQLKVLKIPLSPLMFIAPRGLITILLFLSIDQAQSIPLVNKSLIIQVIILSALVMMVGLMTNKKVEPEIQEDVQLG